MPLLRSCSCWWWWSGVAVAVVAVAVTAAAPAPDAGGSSGACGPTAAAADCPAGIGLLHVRLALFIIAV